ncbi:MULTISPECIES: hypothetical protein [Pseudomonas]|uniref:hypothetical protein n=1 Tax=Pseudomonas TaxID=286 RepID=UPI00224A87CC|nr:MULTISPECIES: hypothetical protein [unclassified Pseudomonas]MCX2889698.1 hypothetical protein [Pseudomonas sp. DCB_BI]MDH4553107.1 hypothetical protein [Pseudomonas sp. BN607]
MVGKCAMLALLVGGFGASWAQAGEITLDLRYRGDTRQFENLTPRSSPVCTQLPQLCADPLQSLLDVNVEYSKTVDGEGADGFYLSAPVQPTPLLMVRDQTGEQVSMDFAITHLGGTVSSEDGAPTLAARTGLDSSGCQVALASAAHRLFLWSVASSGCWANLNAASARIHHVSHLTLGYRLKTPLPASLKSGVYRGRVVYSVGPDREIGLGSSRTVAALTADSVAINVTLEVVHDLEVRFEPGSEQVALAPPQARGQVSRGQGRADKLEKDVAFSLTASGPFRVWALCSTGLGSTCNLRSAKGHDLPLSMAMTLPGVTYHGRSLNRQAMAFGGAGNAMSLEVPPEGVTGSQGQLHFHVYPRGHTPDQDMLPGTEYQAVVTIVFDADL